MRKREGEKGQDGWSKRSEEIKKNRKMKQIFWTE